jgi:hypothetical protein
VPSRFRHLFHPNASLTANSEQSFNRNIFYLTFAPIFLNKAFIFIEIILFTVNLLAGEENGAQKSRSNQKFRILETCEEC